MRENPSIAVIGLGYVGLPTALAFHKSGFRVIGLDINEGVISMLSQGISPISDSVQEFSIPLDSPEWKVTTEYSEAVENSDIMIVTVPTPTLEDKTPDLSYVRSALESILENIMEKSGKIVVLESTVYPGVTRKTTDEACSKYNLQEGVDFHVAYSPERVSPGEIGRSAEDVARIVGSDSGEVGGYLSQLYGKITGGGCNYVGKIEVAEAAKMVENTQRDIDIAFVNELAMVLPKMGINVNEVLDAASTKWNFHVHEPGIGIGGHCIPVDPYYYIELCRILGTSSKLSTSAREINESMPYFASGEILDIVDGELTTALVLGYSYKPEVGDVRETPVKHLIEELVSKGINVRIWDPLVLPEEVPNWVEYKLDVNEAAEGVDIVILATAHSVCLDLDWGNLATKVRNCRIYDGRGKLSRSKLEDLGWEFHGIGMANGLEN